MRTIIGVLLAAIVFSGCNKDKYATVPHIVFKSISPNVYSSDNTDATSGPFLTLQLTDAEGDFGFKDKDSSYVYIRNLTSSPTELDSLQFPDLSDISGKKINAEIRVNINAALPGNSGLSHTDTLFFEVYVKDFAKNKSNLITTTDPLYYVTP